MALLSCGTIGAGEAVRRAKTGELQLLDATWSLPGSTDPLRAHLAGTTAVLDTAAIKAMPLPERTPAQLADAFAQAGLNDAPMIAVYDRKGLFSAPWAWWMLLEAGHSCLLVQGWDEEGPAPSSAPGTLSARAPKAVTATIDDIVNSTAQIVDARPAGRFTGEMAEPRKGMRSGHIPGSLNVPFPTLKVGDRFKTPAELFEIFMAKGINLSAPIITSCGSGVTASGLAFCLSRAGATDVRVYMGSWAEYGASDHPVATGP